MVAARIVGWRAYFVGGVVRSSKVVANWHDLPQDGLLGLAIFFSDGKKRRLTGGDYFFINIAQNKFGTDNGPPDFLATKYPGAFLIRGAWTDDEAMKAVEARMKSDSAP